MNQGKNEKTIRDFGRKALGDLSQTWERLFSVTRRAMTGKVDPDLTPTDEVHIRKKIEECIFSRGGEIPSREKAVELGTIYLYLSPLGKEKFMSLLAREFDVDLNKIDKIRGQYQDRGSEEKRISMEIELAEALLPPRVRLLRQFNSLPNGFKFLIDFRADLLAMKKKDPKLQKLDSDLKAILSSWFDIGLLDLKAITWQSPAALLEKLMAYEAVHAIRSWEDLKNRLVSDRQCFAFFHNKVPDEPLIFVEVALVNGVSGNIQELLDTEAETIEPRKADTAIFYSISNAQMGLAGINLGNFLIKRVVEELQGQLKNLRYFFTLSPVPGFRRWLDPVLMEGNETIFRPQDRLELKQASGNQNPARGLLEILNSGWRKNDELSRRLKPVLLRLCARYLLLEKRHDRALDPVANFHLSNGARIYRLNWLGDTSEKGMKESAGIMANYHYKLSDIEKNHERYSIEARIEASKDIRKWIK